MGQWEYRKLDLSVAPRRGDAISTLNMAGSEGWELVSITQNGIAYLKRHAGELAIISTEGAEGAGTVNGHDDGVRGHGVEPKYRDPATNETWSGRGRMANWLRRKQEAGEDIEKYLI
jgi:H-NS histone family